MDTTDRRAAKRVNYYAEARLEGIDLGRANVRLADLSTIGAFIDARTVLPAAATARLRFEIDSQEIVVTVEVRYSMSGFGMGVRFVDLTEADRRRIEGFVARQG